MSAFASTKANTPNPPETTIDLGESDADDYATRLDSWCRATLASWRAGAIA